MMVCDGCGAWAAPIVDFGAQAVRCPECGHVAPRRFLPLFVVTGASGTGKTAVIPALRRLLPDWEVFETDILWDSGGDWRMVFCNWLRIAHSVAQGGRPTMLCGTTLPERIDSCEGRALFPAVHYLALDCDDAVRAARLRARPAWRGCTEEFVARQEEFAHWLRDNARAAFDPPLTLVDTTDITVEETAWRVRDWAVSRDAAGSRSGAGADITVRFAGAADREFVGADGHVAPETLARKIESREVVVAERADHPVGYLRLEYLWAKVPYIALIWVRPEHRRGGVGRALLGYVETFLRERGHHALYSSSQADEPPPQSWHRHMGFEECGFLSGVNAGGVGEVFFRKALAPLPRPAEPVPAGEASARGA